MLFNYHESFKLSAFTWMRVIYHGLRLDISAGAYLMVFPAILIFLGIITGKKAAVVIMNVYMLLMLFIIVYLGVTDMNLYTYWGFKLDITPLLYLKNPTEAIASVSLGEIALMILFVIILFFFFAFVYFKVVAVSAQAMKPFSWKSSLMSLFFIALLFIPARGGIGIANMNLGVVYFHSNRFANHSAVNVLWNTVYSYVERDKLRTTHIYMEDSEALDYFNTLNKYNSTKGMQVIKNDANIILIILESFSNKIIEPLGGESDVTPEFNKLCKEGLVFTNFFSSGDRSDRALVSLFSGFPAQPLTSIINYPSKTQKLPFLLDPFYKEGYNTAFFYGGNLDFANFRSYFTRESMKKIIDIQNFTNDVRKQKWGVPDEYVYEHMLVDLDKEVNPFFYVLFTLSSHEPFDVPDKTVFGTSNRDDLSRNAYHYADKCLGNFITEARKRKWWDNTLIILVADHGSRSPGNTPNHLPPRFAIPMVWVGGALTSTSDEITVFGSQFDFPATLLSQFGFPYNDYRYSKDLLHQNTEGFAFYTFNNGFGFLRDSVELIYDNEAEAFIHSSGNENESWQEFGKAFLQVVTTDFSLK